MERVGLDLQTTAFSRRADAVDFDLFGRSAFNRYYYATYLEVRAMLRRFNPTWKGSHADIPNELTGWVTTNLSAIQKKVGKIPDNQAIQICKAAKAGAADLAQLLRAAYAVRVLADYEPEVAVVLDGERFRLDRTSITDAHSWLARARADIAKIDRAWRIT